MISSSFEGMKLPYYTKEEIEKRMTVDAAHELLVGLEEIPSDKYSMNFQKSTAEDDININNFANNISNMFKPTLSEYQVTGVLNGEFA